ncbi:acetate--CoA ligase family protein [Pseudobacillus wudalianchiensis]|uniref:Acetyl-CoA synthetase n=1 Tax=Pseudobacillus wudalianchiensis TaxID=1743143 RepID=A0A1B9AN85_9BACI|nr:acetate--CoA ligase family protein [Bacillus wudalianchiensis]OCA85330.1 acetyl-CoA synthetase [Bacillus wudalianchiensis]
MNNESVSERSLESLFYPHSVAVLGASKNPNKLGYIQIKALIDGEFGGDIFPINPNSTEIEGLTCYPSIMDVPKPVDLAIFCVSANQIQQSLEECAQKKVKAAIIFASGFSETGEEGAKQQEVLAEIARKSGIRLIGPNCVGMVNTLNGLVGTFSPGVMAYPLSDNRAVGYVSQSGAFGVLTYMAAAQHGLSFNYFVTVGNEMETEFADIVEYMVHDPNTKVISGYLEGAKDPAKLRKLAKEALDRNKPMIVMKTGRSSAGSRAAASHTGSLAGSDQVYDAFFKQTGMIRANDYEEIISFSKLFLSGKLPAGRNTVLITSSGGRGINEADRCEANGLTIIPLKEETKAKIKQSVPSFASTSNPIDLTAAAAVTNPELFIAPLRALVEDPEVHNIILTEFPMHWGADHPLLQEFIEICKSSDKFIFVTTFPLQGMSIPKGAMEMEKNGIPVITGDLQPISALAKLVDYSEKYRRNQQANELAEQRTLQRSQLKGALESLLKPGVTLSEFEASEILELYQITTAQKALAATAEEAVQSARNIGYPVVLKVDSKDIPHKTDADAIRLHLQNDHEVIDAYADILRSAKQYNPNAVINGVSVQEMLPKGTEVIIGVTKDPVFGPVIMFGLGGIFVETLKDVSFRVAPLTSQDAVEMIEEIKGKAILSGARGQAPADREAIIYVLLKVSELISDSEGMIDELDINPLIVYEKGLKAADALIVTDSRIAEKTEVGG